MNLSTILLVAAAVYCIYRLIAMQKETRTNKKILRILGVFSDKQEFEDALNQEFSPENTPDYTARLQALRVWGGAYHDDEDMFREGLANLDVRTLLSGDNQKSAVGLNESTFFWLLLFAPNNLYSKNRMDQISAIYEKMEPYREELEHEMVWQLGLANKAYYEKSGDLGRAFYDRVMEGDYADLHYTKDLIGIYKHIITAMQCRIWLDEGEMEKYDESIGVLDEFRKAPLGRRWLEELGMKAAEEAEPADEETAEAEEEPAGTEAEPADSEAETAEAEEETATEGQGE
ncbi:MAG: hypothetical protein IJI52_03010 [Solobacterium sp.]|nr:hypothetical protein [Solobacterium sp.]